MGSPAAGVLGSPRGERLRVLCLSIGPEAEPSSRFRVYQLAEPLRRLGVDLEVRPAAGRRYFEMGYGLRRLPFALRAPWVAAHFAARTLRRARDLLAARRYDLLLVQKESFPFGLERLIEPLGLRVVYDFDDAVQLGSPLSEGQGRLLRRAADTVMRRARGVPALLARTRLVVAGNPILADYARARAPRVTVLPTVVDAERYTPAPLRRSGTLTVGWFGAPAGAAYLAPLRSVLPDLARRFDLRLRLHGLERFDCPGVRVECVPWRRYADVAEEVADLHGFDVGLMPLPDTPHAAGKCALKAIQYMACGIPVVASPVGVTAEVLGEGACGLLARSPAEWSAALWHLLEDPDLRARLGAAGRRRVAERYSIQVAAPRLAALLREASEPEREGGEARGSRPLGRAVYR